MDHKSLKQWFPLTFKSVGFILLLNILVLAVTYGTYVLLQSFVAHFKVSEPWKLCALLLLTVIPLAVLFRLARKRRWGEINFTFLFFLVAVSTISLFAFLDLAVSLLNKG